MIVGLEGKLAVVAPDHIVLNVGGVYYKVSMPASSISTLGKVGKTVKVAPAGVDRKPSAEAVEGKVAELKMKAKK